MCRYNRQEYTYDRYTYIINMHTRDRYTDIIDRYIDIIVIQVYSIEM